MCLSFPVGQGFPMPSDRFWYLAVETWPGGKGLILALNDAHTDHQHPWTCHPSHNAPPKYEAKVTTLSTQSML